MTILNDGKVGIGTTAPTSELQVATSVTTTADRGITSSQHNDSQHGAVVTVKKSRGTAGAPSVVANGDYLGAYNFGGYDGSAYTVRAGIQGQVAGAVSAGTVPTDILFLTGSTAANATEKMRITNTGNVGIGTTTPAYKLAIVGSGNDATSGSISAYNTSNGTSSGAFLHVASANSSGYLAAFPSGYTDFVGSADRLVLATNSDATGINLYAAGATQDVRIYTGGATERMRIESSGLVGFGNGPGNYNAYINQFGHFFFQPAVADTNSTMCRNTAGALTYCTSSIRFKEDVTDLKSGLEQIRGLRPVSYTWKESGKKDVGFIAEEVAGIVPEAVTYDKDGQIESFNPNTIISLAVKSLKELDEQVQDQKLKIEELQNKVWEGGLVAKDTTFNGKTTFNKTVTFSQDNAGSVTIPKGETGAEVMFSGSLANVPEVTASKQQFIWGDWRVTGKTKSGFVIELMHPQLQDVTFDWHAFEAK